MLCIGNTKRWKNMAYSSNILTMLLFVFISFSFSNALNSADPIIFHNFELSTTQMIKMNEPPPNFYKYLYQALDTILIGTKENIFLCDLNRNNCTEETTEIYMNNAAAKNICTTAIQEKEKCGNFIRLFYVKGNEAVACGTNSFYPKCYHFRKENESYEFTFSSNGDYAIPCDPQSKFTYLASSTGDLVVGGSFVGSSGSIRKRHISTDETNIRQLYHASVVHFFEDSLHTYFIFHERAIELESMDDTTPTIVSRIGRVCKNDMGFRDNWTTFVKVTLVCPLRASNPFFINKVQSSTDPTFVRLSLRSSFKMEFYTIFRNDQYFAICSYSMDDVKRAFQSNFHLPQSEVILTSDREIISKHINECPPGDDAQSTHKYFIQDNSLLTGQVLPSFNETPLLLETMFSRYPYSRILVDQVKTTDRYTVLVLFVATSNGAILKIMNDVTAQFENRAEFLTLEEFTWSSSIEKDPLEINDFKLVKLRNGEKKLVIVTDDTVRTVPLHRCSRVTNCRSCVNLKDPYCGWHLKESFCGPVKETDNIFTVIQALKDGDGNLCS